MAQLHWMVRLLRILTVIFVMLGCGIVFFYSPFYSQMVVKGLNYFVSFDVNQLAARSQQSAALSEHDTFEPGSNIWIARQAYLQLIEKNADAPEVLYKIIARYQLLQKFITVEQTELVHSEASSLATQVDQEQESSAVMSFNMMSDILQEHSEDYPKLIEKYQFFLETYPVELPVSLEQKQQVKLDLEALQKTKNEAANSKVTVPYAIVVLGGGLTLGENGRDIVVNRYTRLRLQKSLEVEKKYHLPIVLSGVEAPYMQTWLKEHGVSAKLLERRSMNTCENSRFSSLLLQKKGGAPKVMLVTDQYHMPRTRRLFALNGIETVPMVASMPTTLTHWRPAKQNYDHSRRATYELLAVLRDIWFGSSDCREVP